MIKEYVIPKEVGLEVYKLKNRHMFMMKNYNNSDNVDGQTSERDDRANDTKGWHIIHV